MIRNYITTLLRNMQKNKLHAAINIIGLSVAFTCSILLLVMVYHEFSFDNFHEKKTQIFKLYKSGVNNEGPQLSTSMGYPVAPTIKAEGAGIVSATRIKQRGREIRYQDKTLEQNISLVDDDFFSIFSFKILKGAFQHPLASTNNVVLNKKTALNLFGNQNPIGKKVEVKVGGTWINLMVSAVIEDIPKNSSIEYDILARIEIDPDYTKAKNLWNMTHHSVYVAINNNTTQQKVEQRLQNFVRDYFGDDEKFFENAKFKKDKNGNYVTMKLLPFTELHFNSQLGDGSRVSKSFLYILLLIAAVIILIACFNFINLNIGLSFTRTKEIGIRKCLGAGKKQVWLQIFGESFFTVFIAMLTGITFTILLIRGFIKLMQTRFDVSLLYQPVIILMLFLLVLFVSFISSGYPSFIMGKLKTVEVLKGKISVKKPGFFRNTLILVQFVIAIVLMCTTIIIYQQFQHLRNAPLGYNTTSLVSIPIKKYEKGGEIIAKMRSLLSAEPSIVSITGTDVNMGIGKDGSTNQTSFGFNYNGRLINTNYMNADYDILKTLDISLKNGRDFTSNFSGSDSINNVIVTESMAKSLTDKDALGLSFYSDSSRPKLNIVGIIPDFHLYDMYKNSEPLTIGLNPGAFLNYILIKVNTQNPVTTMQKIENAYAKAEPNVEFKGSFVTENIDRWYESEKRLSTMFTIAATVAIILSCMGLFGMAFIIIRQRVKEIGIRKVLGSSTSGITVLVTKEFVKPIIIALLIATPIAWWTMSRWLQDFNYHIQIQWWVFALAGLTAILIALLTISFQAIKAALANPIKSLRTE